MVTAYTENVIAAGKFKLRVIGERDPLPSPTKEKFVNSSFHCHESRDYYVPNRYNRIFRLVLYLLNYNTDKRKNPDKLTGYQGPSELII